MALSTPGLHLNFRNYDAVESRLPPTARPASLIAASGWLVAQTIASAYLAVSGLYRGAFVGGIVYGALATVLCLLSSSSLWSFNRLPDCDRRISIVSDRASLDDRWRE